MREKIFKSNTVHLYGLITDVRFGQVPDKGLTGINLRVSTMGRPPKDGDKRVDNYHDVTMFTDDPKVIESYKAVEANLKANAENKGVEGYKPKYDTVSLDGYIRNVTKRFANSEDTYTGIEVRTNPENASLNVPKGEKEYRDVAQFKGNVGSVELHEDKNFARISLANHFQPKDAEGNAIGEPRVTWLNVTVSGNSRNPEVKAAYDAIVKGDIEKGKFVRVNGQLINNSFEVEKGKIHDMTLSATGFTLLTKKEAEEKDQEVEVKVEPEVKAEEKKAAKKATSKKATSKKTAAPKPKVSAPKL